jgi:hypothetical protein
MRNHSTDCLSKQGRLELVAFCWWRPCVGLAHGNLEERVSVVVRSKPQKHPIDYCGQASFWNSLIGVWGPLRPSARREAYRNGEPSSCSRSKDHAIACRTGRGLLVEFLRAGYGNGKGM